MKRDKVFISYSHEDRAWLKRILEHMAILERWEIVHLWSDDRIGVGADWEREINAALDESGVAVLLLSPSFLASAYIWGKDKEIDRIQDHSERGMAVLPLVVRPCAWRLEKWLSSLQVRPTDGRALSIGDDAQIDLDLSAFVYELAALVDRFSPVDAAKERAIANEHVGLAALLAGLRRDRPVTRSLAPHLAAQPRSSRVLWVDDHPANNEYERAVLRPEGILFDNVVSTREAIEQLRFSRYELVITDLGRLGSSDRSTTAGSDLLDDPAITDDGPPVIVYGGRNAVAQSAALQARGAFGVAADRESLYALVRQALGRRAHNPTAQ